MTRSLRHPLILLAIITGAFIWASQAAQAQMVCGNRADIIRQLSEKYGETRRSMGLAEGRGVVELYASEETGSWTILMTSPQGVACIMAAGQAFQIDLKPMKLGTGA